MDDEENKNKKSLERERYDDAKEIKATPTHKQRSRRVFEASHIYILWISFTFSH